MSLRYSDVLTYVTNGLTALGYGGEGPDMPAFNPGPPTAQIIMKTTPDALVVLTVGNGIGRDHDGAFDSPFLVVRVVGPQGDYDAAETLALDLDKMLDVGGNTLIGSARALYITRTGGQPQLIDLDDGDRYHFQTTYIVKVQS